MSESIAGESIVLELSNIVEKQSGLKRHILILILILTLLFSLYVLKVNYMDKRLNAYASYNFTIQIII